MKIVFISNFLNHHQIPICEAFSNVPNVEFIFIATEKVPKDRIKLGYKQDFAGLPYYIEAREENIADVEEICFNSDALIFGSAPMRFIKRRLKARKLTFSYNERWFKEGFWRHPGDILRAFKHFTLPSNKNYYQLCASAYTAGDSNRVFAFRGKKLRFGYFPEFQYHNDFDKHFAEKTPFSILWVGRLIDVKHPEIVLDIADKLKKDAVNCDIKMIGSGELSDELQRDIHERGLADCVQMLGSMSPEAVRDNMDKSQIFLFTSDFREGWGAVLNEAMNSGCAVVASHAIGSVPYLINCGENGYVYTNGDTEELYSYVKKLLLDRELCKRLGLKAYSTIDKEWNANVAVSRLYEFCRAKLSSSPLPIYKAGPISEDAGRVKKYGKFKHKKH